MSMPPASRSPALIWLLKLWLAYGAFAACTGWGLSAIHHLNSTGYLVAICLALIVVRFVAVLSIPRIRLPKLRRFRKPLPLIYLLLLIGSIIGGIIHPPNNYDMLTYRVPRMLNWLADGRWHWITGYIDRMNYSGTGFEWSAMPLLLLARGTSLFFLINIISYLFLPGLFFALLRRFGVGGRVAWKWMWLFPAGLNFVMQAGGGANDTVAVVYLMAAIVFAFNARNTGRITDAYWALIATALMTATKSSNLPLALPCVVALFPAIRLKQNWLATAAVLVVAAMASLLPTLVLNYKITRDIAGSPGDPGHLKMHNPVAGIIGNTLQTVSTNLQPPIMPAAKLWNEKSEQLLPQSIRTMLDRDFPRFTLHTGELPQEESAGVGLGLTVMAVLSLIATAVGLTKTRRHHRHDPLRWAIIAAGLVSVLAFMVLLGSESSARLLSPYYLFMIAPVLVSAANDRLVRSRWWNGLAILAALMVIPGLILSPSRPLFPAVSWTESFARKHPASTIANRAATVYRVYNDRAENIAPLRKYLPANRKVIGIVGMLDTSETPLWEPLFTRRVIELTAADTPATLTTAGIRYVVIENLPGEKQAKLDRFLATFKADVVGHEQILLRASEEPEDWYVVRLK